MSAIKVDLHDILKDYDFNSDDEVKNVSLIGYQIYERLKEKELWQNTKFPKMFEKCKTDAQLYDALHSLCKFLSCIKFPPASMIPNRIIGLIYACRKDEKVYKEDKKALEFSGLKEEEIERLRNGMIRDTDYFVNTINRLFMDDKENNEGRRWKNVIDGLITEAIKLRDYDIMECIRVLKREREEEREKKEKEKNRSECNE